MPYTLVRKIVHGAYILSYALEGKGHNGEEKRNVKVARIWLHNGNYLEQMRRYWLRARSNHKAQIFQIIQSFSKNELNPDDPVDIEKANIIGQKFVLEHYKNRQALVCTQKDGKGGCLHNHILINDVSFVDYKGCGDGYYHHANIKRWSDEIAGRYTVLDMGAGKNYDNVSVAEMEIRKRNGYSYIDDIRQRVSIAMSEASSESDFYNRLIDNGVAVTKKTSKKGYMECGTECFEYYLFELIDISDIPEKTKLPNHDLTIRSFKLGTAYGPRALEEHLAEYADKTKANADADIVEDEPDIIPSFSYKSEEKVIANEEISNQNQPVSPIDDTEIIVREHLLHKRMNEADSEEEEPENNSPYSIPGNIKTTASAKSVANDIETEGKAVKAISNSKPDNGTAPVSNTSAKPNGTRKQGTEPPVKNKNKANSNNANNKANKAALLNYVAKKGNPTDQKDDDDCPFYKE